MTSGGLVIFILIAILKNEFWQVVLVFHVRQLHNILNKVNVFKYKLQVNVKKSVKKSRHGTRIWEKWGRRFGNACCLGKGGSTFLIC